MKLPENGQERPGDTMTQKAWLKSHGMPVSKVRKIVRAQGNLCLRCLSRPRVYGSRCGECKRKRDKDNKGRKR